MNRFLLTLVAALASVVLTVVPLLARINLFDPWYPGIDSHIGPLYSYRSTIGLIRGERLIELPVSMTCVSQPRIEVGGRWGLRSFAGNTGINDLQLGMKYQFVEETAEQPFVIGEAGIVLPTADADHGLGAGAVGLLLNWALQKNIDILTGYFGLGVQVNSENANRDKPENVFFYRIGASYPYREPWRLYGEFKGFNHGIARIKGVDVGESYQELYLAPGASYVYDNRTLLSAALLIGLTPESQRIGLLISTMF